LVVLLLLFRCNSERPVSVPDVFRSSFFSDRFKVIEEKMYALQFPQALQQLEELIDKSELSASEQKHAYLQAAFLNLSLEKTKQGLAWIQRFQSAFPDSSRWSTAVKAHYHLVKGMAEYQELKLFEAKEEFLKAIPLLQKVYTNNHYYVAGALTQLGLILFDIDNTQVLINEYIEQADIIYQSNSQLDKFAWDCYLGQATQHINDRATQKSYASIIHALHLYKESKLRLPIFHGRCLCIMSRVLKKIEDAKPSEFRDYSVADSCLKKAISFIQPTNNIRLQEFYRDLIMLHIRFPNHEDKIKSDQIKLAQIINTQKTDVFGFIDRLEGYCHYREAGINPNTYQALNLASAKQAILSYNNFIHNKNRYHKRHLDEAYYGLIHAYASIGNYNQSVKLCRNSIELFQSTTHSFTFDSILQCRIDKSQVAAWVMSGIQATLFLKWAKTLPGNASDSLLFKAIQIFKYFDQNFFLSILNSEEDALNTFQYEVTNQIYPSAIEACYLYHQTHPQESELLDLAFRFCERRKSYQLYRDVLGQESFASKSTTNDSLRILQSNWNKQYFAIYHKNQTSRKLLRQFAQTDHALKAIFSKIKNDSIKYRSKVNQSISTIKQIQQQIGANKQVLQYSLADNHLFIIAIDSKKVMFVKIQNDSIIRLVDLLTKSLSSSSFFRHEDVEAYSNYASQLYGILIKPVEKIIRPRKTTIVIPDQVLHLLPFECLLTKTIKYDSSKTLRKFPYFLYNGPIQYSSSWKIISKKMFPLALHKPSTMAYFWAAHDVFNTNEIEKTLRLHFQNRLKVFTKRHCNQTKFIDNLSKLKGLVHLSVHAQSSLENRFDNKLKFPYSSKDSGYVYGFDISSKNLQSISLLTLASCQTNFGQTNGEGVFSLSRSFIQAGVNTVIGTLWSVDNGTTNQLLNKMYHNLSQGITIDKALWLAKKDFIKNSPINYPNAWAGIILIK